MYVVEFAIIDGFPNKGFKTTFGTLGYTCFDSEYVCIFTKICSNPTLVYGPKIL